MNAKKSGTPSNPAYHHPLQHHRKHPRHNGRKLYTQAEITNFIMKKFRITKESTLTRVTSSKHISFERSMAIANPRSLASIRVLYSAESISTSTPINQQGIERNARDLEHPTLNVLTSQENNYNKHCKDQSFISIKVSDVLKQNGKLYPDESSVLPDEALIISIPNGEIACKVLSRVAPSKKHD